MPRSMTGFGRYSLNVHGSTAGFSLTVTSNTNWNYTWEIHSVNNRHLDLRWRLPFFLRSQETAWEKIVRHFAVRGRVELFLYLELQDPNLVGLSFNRTQAKAMLDQITDFAAEHSLKFKPDINRLLSLPGLWEDALAIPDTALVTSLEHGLTLALKNWTTSRNIEGAVLTKDLEKRYARLVNWLNAIHERILGAREKKFEAAWTRTQQLLDRFNLEMDRDRLLQELVLLADRLDISEELTRLSAHISLLKEIICQDREAGKRLDFTLQECFREINTCSNKAHDAQISRLVVDFKAELEKCREQVQNLE
ncbi:YicC family protein [Desulfovibrionales bacterium]